MKKTTKINIAEYNSPFTFNKAESIIKLVQTESNMAWGQRDTRIPTPQFTPPEVAPLSGGVHNLVRNFLP